MRLSSLPGAAVGLLGAVGVVLVLAWLRPSWWVFAGVAVAVLAPGRWWRWRTRRFRRGLRALERDEPREARRELERFLGEIEDDERFHRAQPLFNMGRRYPYRAAARSNLGLAALREGRTETALERFDEALAEAPDHAQAHYGRALALRDAGRPEAAEAAAVDALEARPGYVAAAALLGLIRREHGDEAGAEAALEEVREEGEDPAELLERLRDLWPASGGQGPPGGGDAGPTGGAGTDRGRG